MIERFCPDRFITSARIRMAATLMLAATIIGLLAILLTAHGTVDALGRPVGTDFSNVYSAGWMADHGRAPDAWDWPAEHAMQKVIHKDPNTPLYGWHYPPPFLIIATLLAQFPYLTALFIWQGLSLALALLVFHRILPGREAMLAAVGAPVVMVCLGHGQNAFMTASLMAGGMLLLDRRPWVAGILLGCLVYKPQFAVLIPIVIAMKGNWRAFLAAGLTVVALCLLTWAIWGWGVWAAFIDSLPLTRHLVIELGSTGWAKIQSPFSAIRHWGGSIALAYMVQAIITLVAIAAAALAAWRGSMEVRGSATLTAALLCTPYVLDYDYVLLGGAIAFHVADMRRRGSLPWEPTILALAWFAPLFGRSVADLTTIPLNLIAVMAMLALAVRRVVVLDDMPDWFLRLLSPRRPIAG
ncbi:MAG: DUF2029 domain-containing protein [Sphingobium yanoikuyae]|uniref:glycosyltransferase family 87 protein n=1 Tax=Sphingobium yanoikuyae TaxID=13690 RepID=UPI001B09803B|nr:DUF2029 domain-containing protein [Sphingobium yanoikuyae]